jgi:hypothetical protein
MMVCTRCGRRHAFAEDAWERLAKAGGPAIAPNIPAGLCMECAFKDPELRESLKGWTKEMRAWGVRSLRELLARPLEMIDRIVDSWREE